MDNLDRRRPTCYWLKEHGNFDLLDVGGNGQLDMAA
ncbi:hypothetical protein AB7M42_007636 [Bradyrhizobium diazoefficiens]|jgi:hypothetical protein|uniref:Uncharacterized protein n=1 Tax=Bradyrhizobium ottawaense TaxID=931866 RepID=A0ABV4FU62_9BRAD|nr:hypothetical protein [Bradyrhizobium japonicum]MCS3899427.1 hypothetical protein [Bradyrhizobium japonicum USDA 38]MCS3933070.1 hypothetical protein [Bradyrhizobium elkanii]MBP1089923.1 hypothetical protein [Bradyrhizobium japonicum]MCS3942481.1 hypothetical protein [Bradyrhizobium japonicum]